MRPQTAPMTAPISAPPTAARALNIGLWLVQILLCAFYGITGSMKAFSSPDALIQMGLAWVATAPLALVRFIGIAELAGAAGIVLPALTRILPGLTPLAAIGLATIQILAIPFHISRGEFAPLPLNVVLLALALFVVWGRSKTRIKPRRLGA